MKFDFSDISYGEITGVSLLSPNSFGSNTECVEPESGTAYADKFLDTVLGHSAGSSEKRDSITDFYSDLAASTKKKRTLAINKT